MGTPRTVVVVNPHSQGGKLGKRWRDIADTIGRGFPFDEAITTGPGDATRLTREALRRGVERIVGVGGDGTVNEIVNGFFDDGGQPIAPAASFALIPFGTGGDFRRSVHMPVEIAEAVAVIVRNHTTKIDVGRLRFVGANGETTYRMFANIASFGVSGVVDRLVNESGKKFGRLSFAVATLRATWSYKNKRVQLLLDGTDRIEATINTVAIANGKYFGGGMMVAPAAELDDGQFDVIAMGDFGFGDLVKSGSRVYKGTHLTMDKVTSRRARVVEAEPIDKADVVELDVDGESPGRLPARFEIVPAALSVVRPAS
ncbi:MAG TPA: diacylglycerol kinase family protein [Kofleriaceae bacterium]|jgi:YegS/Rv2252/BmrU family lipid kinase|nr:diacylglycerol kinase family protein [Kofleriaceae bacterium]